MAVSDPVELTGQVQNQLLVTEHDRKTTGKKVTLWGYNSGNDTNHRLNTIESDSTSGVYGLVVVNPDGSDIGGGSGGSGTEYIEGDTDASITGTAILWEDGSDTLRPVSAAKPLPVSGSVTANAGTNLNTSALALESGGNLDDIQSAASTIANAIAGNEIQADIVGALPAGTNNIGDVDVASIAAGDNNIGNVDLASAIPAGTNAIGKLTQPATGTLANVTMTGSSVTAAASNVSRRNLMIYNDSGVTVYVKLGSSASSTSFTVKLVDQAYYELPDPVYTGIVTALGASGDIRVTEVT